MRILLPTSVDVKAIVASLNVSPAKAANLKTRIYYFLSRVVTHNDNWKLNEDENSYRSICSEPMKKILGNKEYYEILPILTDPNDPIIEVDHSYSNMSSTGFCKSYRLTEKYNSGEVVFKTLPFKFASKIKRHLPDNSEQQEINERYQFLISQYETHPLGIDVRVYGYIKTFGEILLSKVEDNNPYQTQRVYNLIGRWLYYTSKIESGELNPMVAISNHRANSRFTNLPKVLREFITCQGRPLVSLDLKASQPYILTKVMSNEFFTCTNNGFNLYSIYPSLHQLIMNGSYYIGKTTNMDYYITSSGTTDYHYTYTSYNKTKSSIRYPFMWCEFFSPEELESIEHYRRIPFDKDYYSYVLLKEYGPLKEELMAQRRSLFKKNMMYILYDENENHRQNNSNVQLMNKVFPGVNRWIETAHSKIGKQEFALLMQRAESYLLLNRVARDFLNRNPSAPIFSIHDALYTFEEYIPALSDTLVKGCKDFIGLIPGVKTQYSQNNVKPVQADINQEWDKIKGINTITKFNRKSKGVFSSNIERGKCFLLGHQ
jgi:hypothetical protein